MTQHPVPAVQVDHLTVSYGARDVLNGADFQADRGSFVAIIGPNGSGKTSLIKVLLGIVRPSSGSVRLFGMTPTRVERGVVGYVPQVKTLERRFPAAAIELVVSGSRGRWPAVITGSERASALAAMERVGAAHLADRQLGVLSGGELQRIFLARSLIRGPELVLLDEPAAGIDVAGASDLYQLLEDYQEHRRATVFMVTHDWNVAYHHATHALILNGEQISFGPSKVVLNEQNLRKAFGHVGHEHAMFQRGTFAPASGGRSDG